MSTDAPTPKRSRRRRALVAIAIGLVVALVAGEIGVRVVLYARGKPFDSERARREILLDVSRARDSVPRIEARDEVPADHHAQERFLHPYQGWEIYGGLELLGAEAARIGDASKDADYEVLLVGGSVAAVFGHEGWPRLEERIRADAHFAGRNVHLYAFAHGGYKQPQTINLVQYLLSAGFTPECVLDIDGFNDVAIANDNAARGVSPILPSVPHWSNLAMNRATDEECVLLAAEIVEEQRAIAHWCTFLVDSGFVRSALAHTLVHRRIRGLQSQVLADTERYWERLRSLTGRAVLRGPPFEYRNNDAIKKAVRAWTECSRSLHAICRERGIDYVHVLQPTLHDEGAKPISAEEKEKGGILETWLEGVHVGYPLMREEGARLAANGVSFIDASRVFARSTETLYYDNCHFGTAGNLMLADFIADEFLKRLAAPR